MSETGRAERPITRADEDQLDRMGFVARLADALITTDNKAARGVVVGVTGPWGSGKSSILNLVAMEIKARSPQAIVVRFDPWIVSGHQDLVLSFLREMVRAVANEPANAKVVRRLIGQLQKYAAHLSPLADQLHKGSGGILRGLIEAVYLLVAGDQSLAGRREKLQDLILELKAPIVVLIDELDRIEDEEVRAVAQLVRAVGDFQGISYLLAYDPVRVSQALGRGNGAEHGRSYLEKIVQLPLALPVALPEELRRILDVEVDQVCRELHLAPITEDARYATIADAITPALASTPRDLRRLVGVFHPLAAMVGKEVDLVDTLGFAALMAKAPQTIEQLMGNPETIVDDPLTFAETKRRIDAQAGRGDDTRAHLPEPQAWALLSRLFPALSGRRNEDPPHPNAISRRRGLMTVLRLGLLPGSVSSTDVLDLLAARPPEVETRLAQALADDRLPDLLDRLADIYPRRFTLDDLGFWRGAAQFLNRENFPAEDRFGRISTLADALAEMLHLAAADQADLANKAEHIVNSLISANDMMLAPRLVLDHMFIHGIGPNGYANLPARGGPWFLSDAATASIVSSLTGRWRTAIESGRFFQHLQSAEPLFIMERFGVWDDTCQRALRQWLPDYIKTLALLLFPPHRSVDGKFVEKLCGLRDFVEAAHRMRDNRTLPVMEAAAIDKALARLPAPESLPPAEPRTTPKHRRIKNVNLSPAAKEKQV